MKLGANKFLVYLFSFLSMGCQEKESLDDVLTFILSQNPKIVHTSPNGKYVIFKNSTNNGYFLELLNIDSGEKSKISRSYNSQLSITWLPNGKRIFYQEKDPNTLKYFLYSVNIEKNKTEILNLPPTKNAIPPLRFSSNSRFLAYSCFDAKSELYIYDLVLKKTILIITMMKFYLKLI